MKKSFVIFAVAALPWICMLAGIVFFKGLKVKNDTSKIVQTLVGNHFYNRVNNQVAKGLEIAFRQENTSVDHRLVGFWSKTKYYSSGGFSYVSIQRFSMDSEGTMIIYETVSYASGGGTRIGPSSDPQIETVVKVHTRDNRLYTMYGNPPVEIFVMEFSFSNGYLHLVGADGVKEMWERN
ncbi:hypothetical protein [Cognataquiflexum rubidum]|uniref:hypothetical protein n=1 Tax=Cognataquiflexum rubidum TaxID=2922273 RepID=UPI001F134828|nr:hypothetical protein [Cognataquiflexum rubidum]MCH6234199.1 hypothetical protein [Cognataquiflexum rubidum]